MANFDVAYKIMRGHEGYYQNDPNDPGGETYAGIARRYNPSWSGWKWVDLYKTLRGRPKWNQNLERVSGLERLSNEHRTFALTKFWNVIKGDQIQNQALANFLFDTYWGKPNRSTIMAMQKLLNVNADGYIGPVTLNAINTHPDLGLVLEQFKNYRIRDYQSSSNWHLYGSAWTKRIYSFAKIPRTKNIPNHGSVAQAPLLTTGTRSNLPLLIFGSVLGLSLLAYGTKEYLARKDIEDFTPETTN